MRRPGKPELIRRINRTYVLDLLVEAGPMSRAELAGRTGLSAPAISRAVADLLAEGLVTELGAGSSSGGRRPILLSFNPDAGAILALDIRRTRIIGAVANLDGRILVQDAAPVATHGPGLLDQAVAFAGALARRAPKPLRGAGAVAPGVCRQGMVSWAPALGWDQVPLGDALHAALGCPVYVENDVNALVLGEQWRGAIAGHPHAVGVVVGTGGVGAGILVDGQLYRGRDGAAGEIGAWRLDPRMDGMLEELTSVAAWARHWAEAAAGPEPSVDQMLAAVARRQSEGLAVLGRVTELLGTALANLVTLLNPHLLVLGGEALAVADLLVPALQAAVNAHALYPVPVVPAQLGDQAALLGAVRGVINQERDSVPFVG